jgi:hypothetical protein
VGVEIRRIMLDNQPGKIVCEIASPKQTKQNGLEMWLKW